MPSSSCRIRPTLRVVVCEKPVSEFGTILVPKSGVIGNSGRGVICRVHGVSHIAQLRLIQRYYQILDMLLITTLPITN